MSLYFIINNLLFAFGMTGAIVFVMAAWLTFDSYRLRPNAYVLFRVIGFLFCSFWYLIHALNLGNDVLSYVGSIVFGFGLGFIVLSFLRKTELLVHSVIVLPSFSLLSTNIDAIFSIALLLISYFSWKLWKKEQNPTWIPFSISFLLLAISSAISVFFGNVNNTHPLFILSIIIQLFGFLVLGYWVWQYMRLRIHESAIMILVGATFILATVVTLAFSTILIGRVTAETARNLVTDVKVLDYSISALKRESLAKAELLSQDIEIGVAITKNDFSALDQLAEKFLQKYDLGFLTITDSTGNVLVRANALSRRGDNLSSERSFEEASNRKSFVTIEENIVEGLSIRAGAPIVSKDKLIGTIITGYPLDNAFVDGMKRVTGLEMFVYRGDTSISGTAFTMDGSRRLVGVKLDDMKLSSAVLTGGEIVTGNIEMYGEPFHASYAPISNSDGKIVGMLSAATHQQDIVNIANATNRLTLITVLIIMLVLSTPIYLFAKKFGEEA